MVIGCYLFPIPQAYRKHTQPGKTPNIIIIYSQCMPTRKIVRLYQKKTIKYAIMRAQFRLLVPDSGIRDKPQVWVYNVSRVFPLIYSLLIYYTFGKSSYLQRQTLSNYWIMECRADMSVRNVSPKHYSQYKAISHHILTLHFTAEGNSIRNSLHGHPLYLSPNNLSPLQRASHGLA